MEVILKEDIKNLGDKNDIVTVKNGYGLNYLIPQGLAVLATVSARKVHAENMRQSAHKVQKLRTEAEALATKLNDSVVKVVTKAGENGKIFGSVTTIHVAEGLANLGHVVDRKNITIDGDAIKNVGTYEAKVKIYKDIVSTIKFEVVAG